MTARPRRRDRQRLGALSIAATTTRWALAVLRRGSDSTRIAALPRSNAPTRFAALARGNTPTRFAALPRSNTPRRFAAAAMLLALASALTSVATTPPARADSAETKPFSLTGGAYCALPEPGEKPACLEPARAMHQEFFEGVEKGEVDPDAARDLERELLAEPGSKGAYLALSSLAYGYLQLAHRAAAERDANPVLRERLRAWNALLTSSYAHESSPSDFKSAVREAAHDIHSRTSEFGADCSRKGSGDEECSAELVEAIEQVDVGTPIRSPLRRLLGRIRREKAP